MYKVHSFMHNGDYTDHLEVAFTTDPEATVRMWTKHFVAVAESASQPDVTYDVWQDTDGDWRGAVYTRGQTNPDFSVDAFPWAGVTF